MGQVILEIAAMLVVAFIFGLSRTAVAQGQTYEYTLELLPTARVFQKSHQIRVHLSSSRFPLWDRNTNTGNNPATDAQTRVAHQTIYHDAAHPSHILLPVMSQPGAR